MYLNIKKIFYGNFNFFFINLNYDEKHYKKIIQLKKIECKQHIYN